MLITLLYHDGKFRGQNWLGSREPHSLTCAAAIQCTLQRPCMQPRLLPPFAPHLHGSRNLQRPHVCTLHGQLCRKLHCGEVRACVGNALPHQGKQAGDEARGTVPILVQRQRQRHGESPEYVGWLKGEAKRRGHTCGKAAASAVSS